LRPMPFGATVTLLRLLAMNPPLNAVRVELRLYRIA
jgi:hypothetical protein